MEEENILQRYQAEIDKARIESGQQSLARQQQESFMQNQDTSIVKEQLDLTEEITRIDYLIKGYSLEPSGQYGELQWVPPKNDDMIIFSDYGIHLIRNTICWYLNKNLLLSNFDEATIRKKMWDFTNDLIDTIFMEYDKVFYYPSVKECIDVLKERVARKTDVSCYAFEVSGRKFDRGKVEAEKWLEIENKIDIEIEKIRTQIIKNKLKRFMMITRVIQDSIHATYMRAWKGLERDTIRKYTHVTETRGGLGMPEQQSSGGLWPWKKK